MKVPPYFFINTIMEKVITTINGFLIETYDKKKVTDLADHIDKSPLFNVTEIRMSWTSNQCVILVYPINQKATKEDLTKLIYEYDKLPE